MKRIILYVAALLCICMPAVVPATASAYDVLGKPCAGAKAGAACGQNGSDPVSGSNGILMKVSLVLSTISGIAAVIILLVSGFNYITSAGDASKAASARQGIFGAAIGLAIIMSAEGIIIFVLKNI